MATASKSDIKARYDALYARLWDRYSDAELRSSGAVVALAAAEKRAALYARMDAIELGRRSTAAAKRAADRQLADAKRAADRLAADIKAAKRGQRLADMLDRAYARMAARSN